MVYIHVWFNSTGFPNEFATVYVQPSDENTFSSSEWKLVNHCSKQQKGENASDLLLKKQLVMKATFVIDSF